jgi:hypothetical protein
VAVAVPTTCDGGNLLAGLQDQLLLLLLKFPHLGGVLLQSLDNGYAVIVKGSGGRWSRLA